MNLLRYILNSVIYFIVMNLCYLTMFFANRADINVGVIITIWSINPFFNSIADYYINGEKMHYYHIIGLLSILLCSVAICMKDIIGEDPVTVAAQLVISKDFLSPPTVDS